MLTNDQLGIMTKRRLRDYQLNSDHDHVIMEDQLGIMTKRRLRDYQLNSDGDHGRTAKIIVEHYHDTQHNVQRS